MPFLQQLEARYPHHPRVQYGLHVGYDYLGGIELQLGHLDKAGPAFRTALGFAERMVAADSANQKAFEALARSSGSLGDILVLEHRFDEAERHYLRAIEVFESMRETNARNTDIASMLANAERRLCRRYHDVGRYGAALVRCREAETVLESAVALNRENAVMRANLGSSYVWSARVYRALARGSGGDSAATLQSHALNRYTRGLALLREIDRTDATPEIEPEVIVAEIGTLAGPK